MTDWDEIEAQILEREEELDELASLMEESPAAGYHGRVKPVATEETRHVWRPLDAVRDTSTEQWVSVDRPQDLQVLEDEEDEDAPTGSAKRYVEKPRLHGTAYTYVKIKCRCDSCKAWKRAENARQYRDRKIRLLSVTPVVEKDFPKTPRSTQTRQTKQSRSTRRD